MKNCITKMTEEQREYYLDELINSARAEKATTLLLEYGPSRELSYYEFQRGYHGGQLMAIRRLFPRECAAIDKSDAGHDAKLEGELLARLFYEKSTEGEAANEKA